ncbi:Copper homeostasis protein CutC [Austwickia sp. TVS 96-490-7B]|uniref:copper homeostasis protein CutC n=1 Tax=Austwickia sp. TVS 96-490-7B TaxID=2830843 RepID=UPI001C5769B5|nr:copper homeostasis protein CutC [Austwickia sp. TVS 96-490-7B]MBW3086243.1 Copper homeostasis protein CutC [Austwickia sp. TVS 96-490-7B]
MAENTAVQVEICVGSVDDALVAERAGADRVELCADLGQGGTTPSLGAVSVALTELRRAGVQVMIRPRGGDFHCDPTLEKVALADIAAIRTLPNPHRLPLGFVLGALTHDGRLDQPVLRRLITACGPHQVTLHKAFDATPDLHDALEAAVDLGVTRILTSGGLESALAGIDRLRALQTQSAGRIVILAGGGIRPDNAAAVIAGSGITEIHLRAPTLKNGTEATDPDLVRRMVELAHHPLI